MKPKLFIGSSKEGLDVANAIHSALSDDAECTVWKYALPVGSNTLSAIMEAARASDFGVFVFSPDDTTDMRGQRFLVARDNVLYELGLFSGHLTPGRCFFVLPDGVPIHRPSDLLGITSGTYEANRDDRNWNSAVGPFCNEVRKQIRNLGLAQEALDKTLHELAVKYECCDWIQDENRRVEQKRALVNEMVSFCKKNPPSKRRLFAQNRIGFNLALCAAIEAHPSSSDADLLTEVEPERFRRGFAQGTVVKTIDLLEKQKKITPSRALKLATWLNKLRNVRPDDEARIKNLVARLN
jgi:hypothetical protein